VAGDARPGDAPEVAARPLVIEAFDAAPIVERGALDPARRDAFAGLTLGESIAGLGPTRPTPPTVVTALTAGLLARIVGDTVPPALLGRGVLVEHEIAVEAPIPVHDALEHVARPVSLGVRRGGVRLAFAIETSTAGRPLARQRVTVHLAGATNHRDVGPVDRHAAPVVAALTNERRIPVDRDLPPRYAALTGEDAPIHLSDEAARAAGLPGVILHGSYALALAANLLTAAWTEPGGRPFPMRIGIRFVAPVVPPTQLAVRFGPSSDDPRAWAFEVADAERLAASGECRFA
jgi:acyl dehydratase